MTKAPTAELRPNQKDQDSLPEYAELDAMLNGLVEQERSVDDIAARRPSARGRQPDAEHVVHRRIQTAPGPSRGQDIEPELRPRPAISNHQQVSRSIDFMATALSVVLHGARTARGAIVRARFAMTRNGVRARVMDADDHRVPQEYRLISLSGPLSS